MKENTVKSAYRLRVIAGFVLAIGLILALIFISIGIAAILSDKVLDYREASRYRYTAQQLFLTLSSFGGIGCVIIGVITFWIHFVSFVTISAQATLIENSDRTDVVKALESINETLKESKKMNN